MLTPQAWIGRYRNALGYCLGLKECYEIYKKNKGLEPEKVAQIHSTKPKKIDYESACILLLEILHSLEARGIDLNDKEEMKWIRASELLAE
jgi:hypothetical protein